MLRPFYPTMKILERLEDYTLDRLAVVRGEDGLELHGWFGGTECLLDAKPSALAAGLVGCIPLDPELALEWPMQVRVEADGVEQLCDCATADPRAAAALRRLRQAMEDGHARAGMEIEKGED